MPNLNQYFQRLRNREIINNAMPQENLDRQLVPFQNNHNLNNITCNIERSENMLNYDTSNNDSKANFPWLYDDNGKAIPYNETVSIYEAVSIYKRFICQRYKIDPTEISQIHLSQFLSLFKQRGPITYLELWNHAMSLQKEDPNFYKHPLINEQTAAIFNNKLDSFKPFGLVGDYTFNEAAHYFISRLREIDLERLKKVYQFSSENKELLQYGISYGFVLKAYLKFVHNRPYSPNLTPDKLNLVKNNRNRALTLFSIIGAPISVILLRNGLISISEKGFITLNPNWEGLKDYLSSTMTIQSSDSASTSIPSSSSSITSFILPLIIKLKKKLPGFIKLGLILIGLIYIGLKIMGYINPIEILKDLYYLKLFCNFLLLAVIFYFLLSLVLLYLYHNKKIIDTPNILPSFFIRFLKEIKSIGSSSETYLDFIKYTYFQLYIYLILFILLNVLL